MFGRFGGVAEEGRSTSFECDVGVDIHVVLQLVSSCVGGITLNDSAAGVEVFQDDCKLVTEET